MTALARWLEAHPEVDCAIAAWVTSVAEYALGRKERKEARHDR